MHTQNSCNMKFMHALKGWTLGMQTKDQKRMVKFIMIKPKIMYAHWKFMQTEIYACIERMNMYDDMYILVW